MKEVLIYIRPNKYFSTKDALNQAGFGAFSSENVLGRGSHEVVCEVNYTTNTEHPLPIHSNLVAKKQISLVVRDTDVKKIIDIVVNENRTGNHGDGKIFVLPVTETIRIRTGEKNDNALV